MAYPVEVYVGVDWFIGSIMMCYLMYPIIQILTDKLSNEKRYMVCHWWDCSIILFDADERMVSWNGFILQYIF